MKSFDLQPRVHSPRLSMAGRDQASVTGKGVRELPGPGQLPDLTSQESERFTAFPLAAGVATARPGQLIAARRAFGAILAQYIQVVEYGQVRRVVTQI